MTGGGGGTIDIGRLPQSAERRRMTTADAVSLTLLALQFGVLIWGASSVYSSLCPRTRKRLSG